MKFTPDIEEVVDPNDELFMLFLTGEFHDWSSPVYHGFIKWMNKPKTIKKHWSSKWANKTG